MLQLKITSLFKKYVSVTTSRAESTQSGGIVNAGGWGTRKNSVPIPRGVHAARQKHAPCVEMLQNLRTITTYVYDVVSRFFAFPI